MQNINYHRTVKKFLNGRIHLVLARSHAGHGQSRLAAPVCSLRTTRYPPLSRNPSFNRETSFFLFL